MATSNFTTTITVDNSPSEVYDAINNVGAWWHGEVIGNSNKLNDEFTYEMKPHHFSKQKVAELVPNKRVVWLVTDSQLNFVKTKDEWTGTKIIFEISEAEGKTQLRFTHEGLTLAFECYGGCSSGWTDLMHKSLLSLITTGKGVEVF